MSTTRRLAAILAADVVGYSRLLEQDEAGTLAALKERRRDILNPLVAEHHGRIVKVMGDGVLVEFGSAVNAVACAVELQKRMVAANDGLTEDRHIDLRVGINLGDVVVEGGDLYGDGVIIAVRLQGMAEPGGICISGTVREHVGNKLPLTFEDLGAREIKNIAKPVQVFQVSLDARDSERPAVHRPAQEKPSIAVLPFTNLSGDQEQEYFSDGITEDIITELSRFRNLFVIARNSSFVYKGKSVNIGTIARELGVEYVLEGSVRRAGQRVRITAQLIDAATGNHIWAERYDRELADIFAVQDEVTSSIVGTLAVELEGESLGRAQHKRPEDLLAYEHWLRGKRLIFLMGQHNLEARKHFERAVALDPRFSRAHSGLALTFQMEALYFPLPRDFSAVYEKSFQCAQRSLLLDETNHQAHLALAYVYLYRHDYDQAKKHIERAVRLNPSDGDTLSHAGYFQAILGNVDEGIKLTRLALRVNPHHPDWYLAFLSVALFTARNYPEALAVRLNAPEAFIDSSFFGAATLAHMGRLDEAKRWGDKGLARLATTPGGALAIAEGRVVEALLHNNPFRRQEDRDHFAEGMRKAGVPG
ncbi:MAG TPA: adenylate/guanylate cyclase domain-containing protein [Bradyrhizobium sp.]|nr:adenylate/guanylate cyclase domain-containing protein [Bradyrhizobium sp.]